MTPYLGMAGLALYGLRLCFSMLNPPVMYPLTCLPVCGRSAH